MNGRPPAPARRGAPLITGEILRAEEEQLRYQSAAAPHLFLLAQFNGRPVHADLRVMGVILLIAEGPEPGSRPRPGRLPGLPAARYHPLGVEQEPGGA